MAIKAINDTTEINEGQWICGESELKFGLCGLPRQVLRVSGARVYTKPRDDNDKQQFQLRKTSKFICDSRVEGEKLADISRENHEAISASADAINAANLQRISGIAASTVVH